MKKSVVQGRERLSLKLVTTCLLGALAITSLTMVAYVYIRIKQQAADALVVNMAGRQRMLNQRHMKEILLRQQGFDADYIATRSLFLRSLQALHYGGEVELAGENYAWLPATQSDDITSMLEEQRRLFTESIALGDRIINSGDQAAIAGLMELNQQTHNIADKAVRSYGDQARAKLEGLLLFQYCLFAVMMLLVGAGWIFLRRKIVLELESISKKLRNVAYNTAEASAALQDCAEELLTNADQQAATMHETMASLIQLNSSVDTPVTPVLSSASRTHGSAAPLASVQDSLEQLLAYTNTVDSSVGQLTQQGSHVSSELETYLAQMSSVMEGIADDILYFEGLVNKAETLAICAELEAGKTGRNGGAFAVLAGQLERLAQTTKTKAATARSKVATTQKQAANACVTIPSAVGAMATELDCCRKQLAAAYQAGLSLKDSLQPLNQALPAPAGSTAHKASPAGLQPIIDSLEQWQASIDVFQSVASQNSQLVETFDGAALTSVSDQILAMVNGSDLAGSPGSRRLSRKLTAIQGRANVNSSPEFSAPDKKERAG